MSSQRVWTVWFATGLHPYPTAFLLLLVVLASGIRGAPLFAQQVGDTTFVPDLGAPAFPAGQGPRVGVDEGHGNFHTVDGRYGPFARVLSADGFVVESFNEPFTSASLEGFDLLVIANPLHPRNESDWSLPTPSAFSPDEILAVGEWVESGGSLFLLADHMPFPGAAADLAAAFGFELNNGFAVDPASQGPLVFRVADGSLASHPIVTGGEGVDSLATFTGSAFRPPAGAVTLLTLPEGFLSLMPDTAWQFHAQTEMLDVGGWAQGAVMEVGEGRIAVFGEAAMFSAQRAGTQGIPMGMNAPVAAQNARFLVNLVRWLTVKSQGGGAGEIQPHPVGPDPGSVLPPLKEERSSGVP